MAVMSRPEQPHPTPHSRSSKPRSCGDAVEQRRGAETDGEVDAERHRPVLWLGSAESNQGARPPGSSGDEQHRKAEECAEDRQRQCHPDQHDRTERHRHVPSASPHDSQRREC